MGLEDKNYDECLNQNNFIKDGVLNGWTHVDATRVIAHFDKETGITHLLKPLTRLPGSWLTTANDQWLIEVEVYRQLAEMNRQPNIKVWVGFVDENGEAVAKVPLKHLVIKLLKETLTDRFQHKFLLKRPKVLKEAISG